MQLKKIILLTITVVCLLMISAVSAAEIDTNDTTVSVSDNGELVIMENNFDVLSDGQGTYSDLRDEINAGGNNIYLAKSTYSYSDGDGSTIEINNSCVIDGKGAVIDMAGSNIQGFNVSASGVTIKNLTIKNINFEGNGGAIYFSGLGTVENCNFINNTVNNYENGGAIYNGSAVNCTFISNRAYFCGGAIGGGTAVNCTFTNNEAEEGGAIGGGTAVNCTFISNSVLSGGGAMGGGTAVNCIFDSNFAWGTGGAMGRGTAVNCSFIDNSAGKGGAMGSGTAVNCTFTKNHVADIIFYYAGGGAMYKGSAVNCTFTSNYARDGGAIYEGSAENCSFVKNSAIINPSETNYDQGRGGAMYHGSAVNCNFTGNSAYRGNHIFETRYQNCRFGNAVILSSDVTKYYGDSKKHIIKLNDDNGAITGANIQITINNETFVLKTDLEGQISVDLNLSIGEYDLTAVYDNVSKTSKVNIKSTVATDDAFATYLNSKISASFLNTDGKALSGKQVTFKVNDKNLTANTDEDGVATVNVDWDIGNYTVTAVNPVNGEEKPFRLVIDKASTAIILTSTQKYEVVTLTATFAPTNINCSIVFNINGKNETVAINNSKAVLTFSDLNPGNYSAIAMYNGDNNFNASTSNTVTFNIAESYPILTANPVTKTYETSNKLVVNLVDSKGNKISNAYVKVVIGSAVKTIKTNVDGKATMNIDNAPGSYTATITYGDAKTTAKITVKKATPKLTAKSKTFKKTTKTKKYAVTLKTNQNKVMKNTKVYLKVNGKSYSAKTNAKGQATFKIAKLTKKGKFTATVTYKGDAYYSKLVKKVKITIK